MQHCSNRTGFSVFNPGTVRIVYQSCLSVVFATSQGMFMYKGTYTLCRYLRAFITQEEETKKTVREAGGMQTKNPVGRPTKKANRFLE
jgi:hypothetical protein